MIDILLFYETDDTLLTFRKLCKYYFYINPQATIGYINYYREQNNPEKVKLKNKEACKTGIGKEKIDMQDIGQMRDSVLAQFKSKDIYLEYGDYLRRKYNAFMPAEDILTLRWQISDRVHYI